MSSASSLSFTVTYRGTPHALSLLPDSTLSALQARLEELTNVPPSLQKLIYKGKNLLGSDAQDRDETTLTQAGFKNGLKIQMLGSTSQELTSLQSTESEQRKRERILKERALKAPTKVRSTAKSDSFLLNYRFHQLTPLAHLPNPDGAHALLTKLSEDPAIQHIMRQHQFTVGVLTELAPHEHPELLGLNVNSGQAIKLRLRTDRYDGFRLYKEVRRVLCHELTHNVWGDHDNNFKELNSKLNREVAEFETAAAQGTHYLSGRGDVYEPSSELEAEAHVHILGGGRTTGLGPAMDDSREERRRRVLEATMARLRKEEEELEQSCGTRPTRT
ncbi:WLM-domain-containing protein [Lyophyllum atratum]|nr:WLM-domain-containing protein [Lyophyllum atratum]